MKYEGCPPHINVVANFELSKNRSNFRTKIVKKCIEVIIKGNKFEQKVEGRFRQKKGKYHYLVLRAL